LHFKKITKTMKKYFLQLFVALATIFALNACTKSGLTEDNSPTTVQQDKEFITQTANNTATCVSQTVNGVFAQALVKFVGAVNGNTYNENWVDSMTNALDLSAGVIQLDPVTDRMNYNNYKGVYTWNRIPKTFTRTASPSILVNFPSEPAQLTNNMVFKFTEYADALFQVNALNQYLPTSAKASFEKAGEEIASVNYSGVFSSGSFPVPVNVVFNLYLKPHNYKVTVTRITNLQFGFKIDLGGDCGSVAE
jgi:hypothetical protein